jgi:hypothetical protein
MTSVTELPPELYDQDAEQAAAWCDRCGIYHSTTLDCPSDDDD